MKALLVLLRKDIFWTSAGLLAVVCVVWFWLFPGNFKNVWSKNPFVAQVIKDHDLVAEKSKLISISYYYPNFSYFSGIVAGREQPKKEWMEGYYFGKPYIFHTYYQKAVDLFPDNDAVHYLLGYCEFYMGNSDTAIEQYEKSLAVNPYFFWSYYNLGVIYFHQGEYLKSAMILSKVFTLRKDIALEILHQGPFYRQIWRSISNPQQILGDNLEEGQEDAILLLTACFLKVGAYDQALQMIKSVGKEGPWHHDIWEKAYKKIVNKETQTEDLDLLYKSKYL